MELIRFMGIREMEKYLAGDVLRNETTWKGISKSNSKGFCFFPAEPEPEKRLHYLSGVVDFDVAARFETIGPLLIRKGIGKYRDPMADVGISLFDALFGSPKLMDIEEYSMVEYSKKTLRLLQLGTVVMGSDFKWHIVWSNEKGEEDENENG